MALCAVKSGDWEVPHASPDLAVKRSSPEDERRDLSLPATVSARRGSAGCDGHKACADIQSTESALPDGSVPSGGGEASGCTFDRAPIAAHGDSAVIGGLDTGNFPRSSPPTAQSGYSVLEPSGPQAVASSNALPLQESEPVTASGQSALDGFSATDGAHGAIEKRPLTAAEFRHSSVISAVFREGCAGGSDRDNSVKFGSRKHCGLPTLERPSGCAESARDFIGDRRHGVDGFFKTKMCRFFERSRCRYGSLCSYAHAPNEIRQSLNLTKTRLCASYRRGQCNASDCRFAHGHAELRATGDLYKTQLCLFWLGGGCRAGRGCRHAHGEGDIHRPRPLSPDPPLPSKPDGGSLTAGSGLGGDGASGLLHGPDRGSDSMGMPLGALEVVNELGVGNSDARKNFAGSGDSAKGSLISTTADGDWSRDVHQTREGYGQCSAQQFGDNSASGSLLVTKGACEGGAAFVELTCSLSRDTGPSSVASVGTPTSTRVTGRRACFTEISGAAPRNCGYMPRWQRQVHHERRPTQGTRHHPKLNGLHAATQGSRKGASQARGGWELHGSEIGTMPSPPDRSASVACINVEHVAPDSDTGGGAPALNDARIPRSPEGGGPLQMPSPPRGAGNDQQYSFNIASTCMQERQISPRDRPAANESIPKGMPVVDHLTKSAFTRSGEENVQHCMNEVGRESPVKQQGATAAPDLRGVTPDLRPSWILPNMKVMPPVGMALGDLSMQGVMKVPPPPPTCMYPIAEGGELVRLLPAAQAPVVESGPHIYMQLQERTVSDSRAVPLLPVSRRPIAAAALADTGRGLSMNGHVVTPAHWYLPPTAGMPFPLNMYGIDWLQQMGVYRWFPGIGQVDVGETAEYDRPRRFFYCPPNVMVATAYPSTWPWGGRSAW